MTDEPKVDGGYAEATSGLDVSVPRSAFGLLGTINVVFTGLCACKFFEASSLRPALYLTIVVCIQTGLPCMSCVTKPSTKFRSHKC